MKHLKKLSVVLMLTALFSVTFTSCIDNEVSPIVEAIYASQADLIAAQAGVQNAEAALLLAQADAQQAQAEYMLSLAAQVDANTDGIVDTNAFTAAQRVETLRLLVANTDKQVADAQNAMALAEITFQAAMATAIAAMENAGATVAVNYAVKYTQYMGEAAAFKATKLSKEGALATAELYLKAAAGVDPETTWTLYLAGLNATLAAEQAKVTAAEAAIVTLNTAKANPTAIETQLAGLKTQKATLVARQTELVGLIALAEQNRLAAQKAIDDATAFMSTTYVNAKASLTTWKAAYTVDTTAVTTQSGLVAQYTAAIANYAGTTTTLTATINAAVAAVGQNTTPLSGLKGDIKTIENTLGAYGTAPVYVYGGISNDVSRTGAAALTAYGKLWNADLALLKFEADFAALTATYNAAAADLAAQQAAFDGSTYAADLATANTNYNTALTARNTAQTTYNAAKTAFEANPAGSAAIDASTSAVNDLGYIGTKGNVKTYMRVATWEQTGLATGLYIPKTFAAGQYTYAEVVVEVDNIIASTTAPNDKMIAGDESEAVLWEQNGAALDVDGNALTSSPDVAITGSIDPTASTTVVGVGTLFTTELVVGDYINVNGEIRKVTVITSNTSLTVATAFTDTANDTSLTRVTYSHDKIASGDVTLTTAEVLVAANNDVIYFVEVEADDTITPYINTFNIATNKLGTNSFASKSFTTDGLPKSGVNSWTAVLLVGDTDAGYLSTWNGSGVMGASDTLTAQAALWNMALELAKKQYAFDTGSVALDDAKEEYAYQKGLFDSGLTTRVTLKAAVDAQLVIIGADSTPGPASGLEGQLEALNKQLGNTAFGTPNSGDAAITTATGTLGSDYYMVGTVKTLTAYAVKWNAELALAKHLATTVPQYQTLLAAAQAALTVATREAAEDLIYIAKYTADLAALQAQYDALILTPLYAALNVTLVNATQAKAVLEAENTAAGISIGSLTTLITALQGTVPDYTALITAENTKVTDAKAAILATQIAISKGGVSVAGLQAIVADLKVQIALLTQQIANSEALAAKYKALMDAALSDS